MTSHARQTPVIWLHPSSVAGVEIFNPNYWDGASKTFVQSCWSEYSVLHHCSKQINDICANAGSLVTSHLESLNAQWNAKRFPLQEMIFFAEEPDLHIRIEAFFCGMKSVLDLLAQLLSTEKIVSCKIDGFHRHKDVLGGKIVNALSNNVVKGRNEAAHKIAALILDHKSCWIDQAIHTRDFLVHPSRGAQQLMFKLDIVEANGLLVCRGAFPPEIDSVPIQAYAKTSMANIAAFSVAFLALLKGAHNV